MGAKAHILKWLGGVVFLVAACNPVQGSGVSTGRAYGAVDVSSVRILALHVPAGFTQVGIIQARGPRPIAELAQELRQQAARLGATLAKIDTIQTRFEWVSRTVQTTYTCGKNTCTTTTLQRTEVATTQLLGRAFREGTP